MKLPFFISRSGHCEPIASVRFLVLFNTATLGFQSVSGISTQRSVEYISEGGRNDYPILVPKPQSEPHRRLSKVGRSSLSFELPLSFEQAAAYRKANGQYVRKNQWRETTVTVYIDLD